MWDRAETPVSLTNSLLLSEALCGILQLDLTVTSSDQWKREALCAITPSSKFHTLHATEFKLK